MPVRADPMARLIVAESISNHGMRLQLSPGQEKTQYLAYSPNLIKQK
jgi:hypothetical protein